MNWKHNKYGYGSTCVIDDGLKLAVDKSMIKDEWYGYIFGSKCLTTNTEGECKELCEIGAKNIIDRAYDKICR